MIVGIGIDAVDLSRFKTSMTKYGERMLTRLFTPVEQEYCQRFVSPVEHFAVRFAAKEAFLKAIGTGKSRQIRWQDIEIVNEDSGKPNLVVYGEAARICNELGGRTLYVSLSHSQQVAVAVVVIEN
ncbi:MAG: holo-ACP synthase [Candidatus Sumerlaeia bacterium]|nr:holo-ACP synthase [Candidatus Sumerlaeia bacterium]